jgi:hypothetical protein
LLRGGQAWRLYSKHDREKIDQGIPRIMADAAIEQAATIDMTAAHAPTLKCHYIKQDQPPGLF